MFYTENLEELILKRHIKNNASDLLILGGFIGLSPIEKLSQENIKSTIIYGCFAKHNLTKEVNEKYKQISSSYKANVFYKKTYNHSKIYCWHNNGVVKEIISGSANFSANGLKNDFQEVLFDVDSNDYSQIWEYIKAALQDSESCLSYNYDKSSKSKIKIVNFRKNEFDTILSKTPPSARISFKAPNKKTGEIYTQIDSYKYNIKSGSHTVPDDAVITLRASLVDQIPSLFPNHGINPMSGKGHGRKGKKSKCNAEFLWDDGEVMEMSFEQIGAKRKNAEGVVRHYFKAIRSYNNKALGLYLRKRMGLVPGDRLDENAFKKYGRDNIDLTLTSDNDSGIYYADFSVKNSD